MKRIINWWLSEIKRIRSYSVVHCCDNKGNYQYSVLCIHKNLFRKHKNFIRIKYRKNECEIEGTIGGRLEKEILWK